MAASLLARLAGQRALSSALVSALALGLLVAGPASAAAPSNDSRLRPTIIEPNVIGGVSATNNVDATLETGEKIPTCQPNIGSTVWFRYRPPADMTITLSTGPTNPDGPFLDTVLAVYKSTSSGLAQVACSDDVQASQYSRVMFGGTAGVQLWIQVSGYRGQQGTFALEYRFALHNDAFARARTITPGFSNQFGNAWASTETGEPASTSCGGIGRTVWYRFKPSVDQNVSFDTLGSNFDTIVNVWMGTSMAGLRPVTCSDDPVESNGPSIVTWRALRGATYWIQAGAYQNPIGTMVVTFEVL